MSERSPKPQISVVDDPAQSRYELRVDGEVAGELVYKADGTRRTLVHTEIDPAFEGHGLGSHLAAGALEDARRRGFTVVPICPFVTAYLREHPEQLDVVEEPYRSRLRGGQRSSSRGRSPGSSRQAGRGGGSSS